VHRAGGRVFVWTVDDAERIARLSALGVDGVITNDPRLFVASAAVEEIDPGGPAARIV
jgi:glycerophosphoryl diester phosphodiesterase